MKTVITTRQNQIGRPKVIDILLIGNDGETKATVNIRPEFVPKTEFEKNDTFILEVRKGHEFGLMTNNPIEIKLKL